MDFGTSSLSIPPNMADPVRERSPWTQERLVNSALAFSVEPSFADHGELPNHELCLTGYEPSLFGDRPTPLQYPDLAVRGADWPSYVMPGDVHRSTSWQASMASPSDSGMTASYPSSHLSDSQSPPWHSPPQTALAPIGDAIGYHYQRLGLLDDGWCGNDGSYVAPCEVQHAADSQHDHMVFDDDAAGYPLHGWYPYDAQEGYQPIKADEDHQIYQPIKAEQPSHGGHRVPSITADETPSRGSSDAAIDIPNLRRRRVQDFRPKRSSTAHASKVTKRTSSSSLLVCDLIRPFVCPFAPYGCQSSFGSKNEWKRHVNTQHMRLGFWRCDQCPTGERRQNNDFNRKDLFVQHVRRMHPSIVAAAIPASSPSKPLKSTKVSVSKHAAAAASEFEERQLAEIASRCYKHLRQPPQSTGCLFCDRIFSGPRTWDERMEHVGRHMEAMKKEEEELVHPSQWRDDDDMQAWLLSERLISRDGKLLVLAERKP